MNISLNEANVKSFAAVEMGERYSLAKTLGIWAPAPLPGGPLFWQHTSAIV